MNEQYDVVFHTQDGNVRCGPLSSYARAQEFIMGMDPAAFDYETVEIVKHGATVQDVLLFRPAAS